VDGATVRRIDRGYGWLHACAFGLVLLLLACVAGFTLRADESRRFQTDLAPFYTPPEPLPPGQPGDLIRVEGLTPAPAGATAWRILYRSQDMHGNGIAVSGMVFVPTAPAPPGGRPIVAWAHPTTGMADECAPSRQRDPASPTTWLDGMLANGWIVAATDYAGLGTSGTLPYLVGTSAGQDVINSVRAAQKIEGADAGTRYATWGHSEGGHASLWAGASSTDYAPELSLVGVAAAAPAAELVELMHAQWQTVTAQVLGPYAVEGWTAWYPQLEPGQVLTEDAARALPTLAGACLEQLGLEALGRVGLQRAFFALDPTTLPAWSEVAQQNTPGPVPASVPVFIANGTADDVVLPATTTELITGYCRAGIPVTADWMVGQGHTGAGNAAGPAVTAWLADRFAGTASPSSAGGCGPAQPPSGT
jgi:alpha-beta hydrolase superfamily lysophospholipase